MDKIILQDLEVQISEMWDAVINIDNPSDRDIASDQARGTENKLREAYRKQENLRDSAGDILKHLKIMTALVRLKYGNLNKDVYGEIEVCEKLIQSVDPEKT